MVPCCVCIIIIILTVKISSQFVTFFWTANSAFIFLLITSYNNALKERAEIKTVIHKAKLFLLQVRIVMFTSIASETSHGKYYKPSYIHILQITKF